MPPSLARALSLAGALGALAGASAFVPSVVTPSHQPMDRRAYQPVRAPKFYGVPANSLAWNYTYKVGFLAAGGDLHSGPYTYADAVAFCDADDDCAGHR